MMVGKVRDTEEKVKGWQENGEEKARNEEIGKVVLKTKEGSCEKLLPLETLPHLCTWRRATSGQCKGSQDKLRCPELSTPTQESEEVTELRQAGEAERKVHQRDKAEVFFSYSVGEEAPV